MAAGAWAGGAGHLAERHVGALPVWQSPARLRCRPEPCPPCPSSRTSSCATSSRPAWTRPTPGHGSSPAPAHEPRLRRAWDRPSASRRAPLGASHVG
jgi:hypothetical protein